MDSETAFILRPWVLLLLTAGLVLSQGCADREPAAVSLASLSPGDLVLTYYAWHGVSPGAGYISTSFQMIELDLRANTVRRLCREASEPQPMLPSAPAAYGAELAKLPPLPLSPEEAARAREVVGAWLATDPPPSYAPYRSLGREDGHFERLDVKTPEGGATIRFDGRAWASPDDPSNPPPEWFALYDFLFPPGEGLVRVGDRP